MKPIRKNSEIEWLHFNKCHNGVGELLCKSLLDDCGSEKFLFMHCDDIKAGVSIGVHEHVDTEEIYYLLSGEGTLIYDGVEYEMTPGDVSLCNMNHSHGFIAKTDCVLVVVG